MFTFMRHIVRMPYPWPLWVGVLLVANLGAVAFLPGVEAWVVLGSLMLGAGLQQAIFARLGFVRLLGLGHAPWLVMAPWLWLRATSAADPALHWWAASVAALCSVSVVIDAVDVIRYLLGERAPTVVLDRPGLPRGPR